MELFVPDNISKIYFFEVKCKWISSGKKKCNWIVISSTSSSLFGPVAEICYSLALDRPKRPGLTCTLHV